ncbi:MAG: FHA domain-containing protein [bacterium]
MPVILRSTPEGFEEIKFESDLTIGRDRSTALYLKDDEASRNHAVLTKSGKVYLLKDLDSMNGTFLNGHRIKEEVLRANDEIIIGSSLLFFNPNEHFDPEKCLSARGKVLLQHSAATKEKRVPDLDLFDAETLRASVVTTASGPSEKPSDPRQLSPEWMQWILDLVHEKDTGGLLSFALHLAIETAGGDRGVIMQATGDERDELFMRAYTSVEDASKLVVSQAVLEILIKKEKAVFCPDISKDEILASTHLALQDKVKTLIALPLFSAGNYYGFLYLDARDWHTGYTFEHLKSLYVLMELIMSLNQSLAATKKVPS